MFFNNFLHLIKNKWRIVRRRKRRSAPPSSYERLPASKTTLTAPANDETKASTTFIPVASSSRDAAASSRDKSRPTSPPSPLSNPPRHVYQKLNKDQKEIRILHLEAIVPPADENVERCIKARFETTSLCVEERAPYMALSYVWGEPQFVSNVLLPDGSYIPMTMNLLTALVHLFENGFAPGQLPIWIDGLSINQRDDVEKSWQVQQMHEVYSSAEKTVIFLGSGDAQSDEAITLFEKAGQEAIAHGCLSDLGWLAFDKRAEAFANRYFGEGSETSSQTPIHPAEALLHNILASDPSIEYLPFRLISAIMDRPWWRRMWVIQELMVSQAPIFMCGHRIILPDKLVAAVHLFTTLHSARLKILDHGHHGHRFDFETFRERIVSEGFINYGQLPVAHFYLMRAWGLPARNSADLISVVQSGRVSVGATNPRDHIIPLLILATFEANEDSQKPEQALLSKMDYTLPCSYIYTITTSALLQGGCNNVLRLAISRSRLADLPSWVPDFSSKQQGKEIPLFSELGDASIECNVLLDGVSTLRTRGANLGIIKTLFDENLSQTIQQLRNPDQRDREACNDYFRAIGELLSRSNRGQWAYHHYKLMACSMCMTLYSEQDRSRHFKKYQEVLESTLERMEWRDDESWEDPWNRVTVVMSLLYGKPIFNLEVVKEDYLQLLEQFHHHFPRMHFKEMHAFLKSPERDPDLRRIKSEILALLDPVYIRVASLEECYGLARMMVNVRNFSPFVCDGMYLGMGSSDMRDGDILAWLAADPQVLFILRPTGDGLFKLVGEAFVAQLMEDQSEKKGVETEFVLC